MASLVVVSERRVILPQELERDLPKPVRASSVKVDDPIERGEFVRRNQALLREKIEIERIFPDPNGDDLLPIGPSG
jgi:hypothetical protein